MKEKFKIIIVFLAVIISFCYCDEKDLPFGAVLETNEATISFDAESESKKIIVNSNRIFTATTTSSWCKTEILEGELYNLKITVDKHEVIGKQRSAEITLSSDGLEDKKITITQEGLDVVLLVAENGIVIETETEFSLEIESNILFKYQLPDWIHEATENKPFIGKGVYLFTVDALPEKENERLDNIVILASDSEISKVVTIPVKQTRETASSDGINKENPFIIEAENCIEGYESKLQSWWAETGNGLGNNNYINAYSVSVSWVVAVIDEGSYQFNIRQMCWGGGNIKMYIDNVEIGVTTLPNSNGDTPDIATFEKVKLKEGMHSIRMDFNGNSDFDKVTVIYDGN